jgi:hypothetical protein
MVRSAGMVADRELMVLGERMAPESDAFQDALRRCYASHERPRCLCSNHQPPLYVAQFGETHILKRMPGTASLHAPWCRSSVQQERTHEGRVDAADPESGRIQIRLAFSLNEQHLRPPDSWLHATTGSRVTAAHRLSLQELLSYLWERAELTRWHPSFEGRRNWAVIRHRVLAAAHDLWLGAVPLSTLLFIPEAFRRETWRSIKERRSRWEQPLRQHPAGRHLILAEVKRASVGAQDCVLALRHIPDLRFHLDSSTYERQLRRPQEVDASGAQELRTVILGVTSNRFDNGKLEAIATLCMEKAWRPYGGHMAANANQKL